MIHGVRVDQLGFRYIRVINPKSYKCEYRWCNELSNKFQQTFIKHIKLHSSNVFENKKLLKVPAFYDYQLMKQPDKWLKKIGIIFHVL